MKSTEKQLKQLTKDKELYERTVKRNQEELSKNEAGLNSINANIKLLNETATEYDLGAPLGIVKMTPVEHAEFKKRFTVIEKEVREYEETEDHSLLYSLVFCVLCATISIIFDSSSTKTKALAQVEQQQETIDSLTTQIKVRDIQLSHRSSSVGTTTTSEVNPNARKPGESMSDWRKRISK